MKYKQYPSYKDSGVEWLGELPSEWNIVRNKQAFRFIKSLVGKKSKEYTLLSLTLQGIKVRDIESGKGKFPAEFDTYQVVEDKDIIFCLFDIDETPRTVGLSGHNGMITGAYNVARCNTKTVPEYMYYYYLSIDEYKGLKPFYTGLRKVVRTETFMNIQLGLPPLQEQQQIANFLDTATAKIDTLIAKQERLIELLKEKRQAVISHAVTKGIDPDVKMKDSGVEWLGEIPEHWSVWKFLHFAPIITCGLASTPTYVDEGIPFLSAQNIQNGQLSLHKYNYIPEDLHLQLTKNRKPEKGDLLVTRVGASIGAACVLDIDMEFSIYVSLSQIRLNQSIAISTYIKYFLGSNYCSMLNTLGTEQGGGVGNLNVKNVERYKVPLPGLKEQQAITAYLDDKTSKIDSLVSKATKSIELLKEKRTALISAAVTGKIDVRDVA